MAPQFAAILLAAGESRRMGRLKQLLPWGGSTVVGTAAAVALAAPAERVVVVLGHRADEVEQALPLQNPRLEVVRSPRYQEGMLASLCAGLSALPPSCEAFFLFLGDQPMVSPGVAQRLAAAYEPGLILLPTFGGRRGHPVLLSAGYREEILALDPSVGLRQLIWQQAGAVREIPVAEAAVHFDLDTPEEFDRYRPR